MISSPYSLKVLHRRLYKILCLKFLPDDKKPTKDKLMKAIDKALPKDKIKAITAVGIVEATETTKVKSKK